MNTKSKLALSLGLLVAPLALVAADSTEKAYVESYRNRADGPVPTTSLSSPREMLSGASRIT